MIERLPIYQWFPIAFQDWLCSFEGWRIERERYGGEFGSILQDGERRLFWSKQDLETYRDKRLEYFIRHSVRTVPYYKRLFSDLAIDPSDIRSIEDLHKIPILSKRDVQQYCSDLLSESIPKSQRITVRTSGTTGTRLKVATTIHSIMEQRATWWRYRHWYGLETGTWCAFFGGRPIVPSTQTSPPFWRYNSGGRQILFSGYHMSKTNMAAYIRELRRRHPPWIHGFPSLLTLLAEYMLENRMDLGYDVRWLTTSSESLHPHQAEIIKSAFGLYPKQHYAMIEGVANFSECTYGCLHVDEDFSAVEFIPCSQGLGYRVIGTNFTNLAMPLLRYDTQDIVTLTDAVCPCGNRGRVVSSIDGRNENYIVLKNGTVLGRLDSIFKHIDNIREAQLRQSKQGDIFVEIVRGEHYSREDEVNLVNELRRYLGGHTEFLIEYVEKLERSPGGKLRFVISELTRTEVSNLINRG